MATGSVHSSFEPGQLAGARARTAPSAVLSFFVTGHDDDEDEVENSSPVPHPDDRLWRHPSEIAAFHAAQARAETVEVPIVSPTSQPGRRRFHRGFKIAASLAAVGAAALTIGAISSNGTSQTQVAALQSAAPEVTPIVVEGQNTTVQVYNAGEEQLANRVFDQVAFALPRVQAATTTGIVEGSGLFLTTSGHIATSASLVTDANYVLVWTQDGQRWNAEVLAHDTVTDVAVLQINSDEWPAAPLGTGSNLRAGQYALTLDHQLDTISLGEVATIYGSFIDVEQSAAVPGSALLDDTGAVIGMITGDGSNRRATPAWLLEQVSVELLVDGTATHTWLGVAVEADTTRDGMVRVMEVVPNSPADRAGILPDDLIDSLNSTTIDNAAVLFQLVHSADPGDDAVLTVTRHGNRRIIIAELGELVTPNQP